MINTKANPTFESFIVEFKQSRENMISILKIVIDQKKVEDFKILLNTKKLENQNQMKDFIKSKYYEFVESIQNINHCKSLIKDTEGVLNNLDNNVQVFLNEFSENYISNMKRKENLHDLKEEKEKLKNASIFFAYLNKANTALNEGQFEYTIQLIRQAEEKYLKKFSLNSNLVKRGATLIQKLKHKITEIIESRINKWLIEISREQNQIGETLYKKIVNEYQKSVKSDFSGASASNMKEGGKAYVRATKNIADNFLLIRNTANLNFVMNKNSLLKSSVLSQTDEFEEFDIINMVSNVDLYFLEQAYNIYKKVDIDVKFIENFRSFRQTQIGSITKINNEKNYELFFSEIIGFIVIQIAVFELLPLFYTKRKFEELMTSFIREIQKSLNAEFESFKSIEEYLSLEKAIFVFLKCMERIGISERIGLDLRTFIIDQMRDKVRELNFVLMNKYSEKFIKMLGNELCVNIEIHNQDEYFKYTKQYLINLDDTTQMLTTLTYPFKLPYTMFVVNVNEEFKIYVKEIFEFIKPLYQDYTQVLSETVRDFLKKFNEIFITFVNNYQQEMNIILAAHICNNIRYIFKSYNYYIDYVRNFANIKSEINFESQNSLNNTIETYEEIIYEQLKNKIKHFLSDLEGEESLPLRPNDGCNNYVIGLVAFLGTMYTGLKALSESYIERSFLWGVSSISKSYFEFLMDKDLIKSFNYYFIDNLRQDIEELQNFFDGLAFNNSGYKNVLQKVRELITLYTHKRFDYYLDKKRVRGENELTNMEIIKFFSRYETDSLKKNNELKGKMITKSDMNSFLNKLKDLMSEKR